MEECDVFVDFSQIPCNGQAADRIYAGNYRFRLLVLRFFFLKIKLLNF